MIFLSVKPTRRSPSRVKYNSMTPPCPDEDHVKPPNEPRGEIVFKTIY